MDPDMPSSTSRRTIARQWELLKQLPGKGPGLSAAELCGRLQSSGHQVSKRTIERDLVELSQLFPLQCNDKGIPSGDIGEA
jgi:predicted DNA-binding transcriptional regulator YafY